MNDDSNKQIGETSEVDDAQLKVLRRESKINTTSGAELASSSANSSKVAAPTNFQVQDLLSALRVSPLFDYFIKTLYWDDLVSSALAFAILNLTYFVLIYGEYSVVTLVSYLALSVVLVSLGLVQYANMTNSEHLIKVRMDRMGEVATRQELEQHVESVFRFMEVFLGLGRRIVLFVDPIFSLKFIVLALSTSIIGCYVSPLTLGYLVLLVLFTTLRPLEMKKDQVKQICDKVYAAIGPKIDPIVAKIPFDKLKLKTD